MLNTTPHHEGELDSTICFVAEAPAREEMAMRRPLVGPSGRIFNECLARGGILRSNVQIENVCREPIGSVDLYLDKSGSLTALGQAAAMDLRTRLANSRANVFVPLGNLALKVLTDQTKITRYRGSILDSTLFPGRKVIPTIHPAATLPYRGKYVWRYAIIDDLRRINRHSAFPDLRLPNRTLHIYPGFKHALEFLEDLGRCDKVALDIECINHQVSCISFASNPLEAMSIPFVPFGVPNAYGLHAWHETQELELWLAIARLLSKPTITKCIQNAMFDVSFLWLRNKILVRGPISDPMIRHRIMFPDLASALEYTTSIYTEEPYYKDDRKLWASIGKSPDRFYRYNAKDSVCCLEVDNILADMMGQDELYTAMYAETISALDPCLYLMTKGMKVRHDELQKVKKEIEGNIQRLRAELKSVADYDFNPNGPQCIKYFYGHKGVKPYVKKRKSRDGRESYTPTCDDKALARILRRDKLPEARIIQEIRNNEKLLGTYLDINYDPDGFLRCSYNLRGTSTTRLSSSKTIFETGMNMQNLDPRYKQFLVPQTLAEWLGEA